MKNAKIRPRGGDYRHHPIYFLKRFKSFKSEPVSDKELQHATKNLNIVSGEDDFPTLPEKDSLHASDEENGGTLTSSDDEFHDCDDLSDQRSM